MLGTLCKYVADLTPDTLAELPLEDAALCQLGLEAGVMPEYADAARAQLNQWRQLAFMSVPESAGRRRQPLLRLLLEELQRNQAAWLNRDEIDFLVQCMGLARQAASPERFARTLELLAPHEGDVLKRLQSLRPLPDAPNLARRVRIVMPREIAASPTRASRFLAGIELPNRGPVLECHGNIRVMGDVPDNATLIVLDGGCWVDGYVLGRVVTEGACEVAGNVAGVIIALRGDVRAKQIITPARIVAKMGSVWCRAAQAPQLVFARRRIMVQGGLLQGRFVTQRMEIAQDARGSEIHVARRVQARRFGFSGSTPLSIIFRKELHCTDYGEIAGPELNRLLSRAYWLRQNADGFDALAKLNQHEAEHAAEALMMHVFAGGETQQPLDELFRLQRRLQVVNRLMASLDNTIHKAEETLEPVNEPGTEPESSEEPAGTGDADESFLPEDAQLEEDLAQDNTAVQAWRTALRAHMMDRGQTRRLLMEAREKQQAFERERDRLNEAIQYAEQALAQASERHPLLSRVRANKAPLDTLKQFLPALKDIDASHPLSARVHSPFFTRALRTVQGRLKRASEYASRAENTRQDFSSVSTQLADKFQVSVLKETGEEGDVVEAEGQFEEGVRLFLGLTEFEETPPRPEGYLTTPEGRDDIQVYVKTTTGVRVYSKMKAPLPESH